MKFSTNDAVMCIGRTHDPKSSFVKDNLPQVTLALNVYAGILQDLGLPEGLQEEIRHMIRLGGLASWVDKCNALTEGILEGLGSPALIDTVDAYRWLNAYSDQVGVSTIARALDYLCVHTVTEDGAETVRGILQFLLFFDRFTFDADISAAEGAFEKFRRVNRKCRDIDNYALPWPGNTLRCFVREEMERIYTPADWKFNINDSHFSSGSTTDGIGRTLIGKLKAIATYVPCLYGSPLYPLEGGHYGKRRMSAPRLMAVPKGFSSRRIIAPEDTYLSYSAQAALEALRRMLTRNGTAQFINEHDQSVNQGLARIGARDGTWSTIDMSAASDSIARLLFFDCLPYPFHDMYANYMSWYVRIPRTKGFEMVPLHSLFTSGNPLTWLTEACWFTALGRVGTRLAGVKGYRHKVFAYGDDLIVPTAAYETVCEVLEAFGHTVNRRKSYGAGVFRESCGGWFYHGESVTPTYWPRRVVRNDIPELVSCACSLQHNLYAAGYYNAAARAAEHARGLHPGLTSSEVGSTRQDLWDPELRAADAEGYRHTQFITKWTAKQSALDNEVNRRLYDMYIYSQYLREGPLYNSEEDRLLGTSSSRYKPLQDFGVPTLVISKSPGSRR